MDGRATDGQIDGHKDDQRETIIPRHYCVAGYKKEHRNAPSEDSDQTAQMHRLI